ncbi:hypothetical protein SAMN04488056_12318 [Cohaesibacter marisflavi]|uniref:Uncharacterized protein n=1 Tax=Cohaesibacter marisflavi TaxID=655353 RepID=A0A1I5MSZ6_9HYPH|nr:hypothetical protein [Cohaesibacter marisflavi]SFP12590.1 hypothetical protein SAMN04488056_12318 [Cohaesibacter marisflavi]
MAKKLDLDKIFTLIPRMEESLKRYDLILETADPLKYDQWQKTRQRAEDRLMELVTLMGGKVSERPAIDHAVVLGGLRASSTGGLSAACSNWIQSAKRKTEVVHG